MPVVAISDVEPIMAQFSVHLSIDGCEHTVPGVKFVLSKYESASPGLGFKLTSREFRFAFVDNKDSIILVSREPYGWTARRDVPKFSTYSDNHKFLAVCTERLRSTLEIDIETFFGPSCKYDEGLFGSVRQHLLRLPYILEIGFNPT